MITSEINFLIYLEKIRSPFLNLLFEAVTALGEDIVLVVIMAVIYFAFSKNFARKIFFVTLTSIGINGIIKNTVKLPRPFSGGKVTCLRPETATGYSFPSGHTQNFATWITSFAIRFRKPILTTFAVIAVTAVGFSRLYIGAHYPSDVVVGALLGIAVAFAGTAIHDRVENKNKLYGITTIIFTVFAIYFITSADAMYEDFFKVHGMIAGLFFSTLFEERFVSLEYNIPAYKKVIRIVLGIIIAYAVKEVAGIPDFSHSASLMLISESVKYFILVMTVLGFYPYILSKLNM